MFKNLFTKTKTGEPDFTNELGAKWWRQHLTTFQQEAFTEQKRLVSWWYVEHPDGEKIHLILENDEIIYSNTSLEAIGSFLDLLTIQE